MTQHASAGIKRALREGIDDEGENKRQKIGVREEGMIEETTTDQITEGERRQRNINMLCRVGCFYV